MKNVNESAEKIVDLNYLTQVSKGNKDFIKEMIGLFLSENPEEIKALENGIRNKDYESIKNAAHKLRSTIPFVGLDKIIEPEVSEIETLATNKTDLEKIKQLFEKVKKVCEKACCDLVPV